MQIYPLHTHNVVLFLISSWKQTSGVRRVVSVAERTWENIDLTFSSLWVRHSILITSTFGNFYDDSLHLGIISQRLLFLHLLNQQPFRFPEGFLNFLNRVLLNVGNFDQLSMVILIRRILITGVNLFMFGGYLFFQGLVHEAVGRRFIIAWRFFEEVCRRGRSICYACHARVRILIRIISFFWF